MLALSVSRISRKTNVCAQGRCQHYPADATGFWETEGRINPIMGRFFFFFFKRGLDTPIQEWEAYSKMLQAEHQPRCDFEGKTQIQDDYCLLFSGRCFVLRLGCTPLLEAHNRSIVILLWARCQNRNALSNPPALL